MQANGHRLSRALLIEVKALGAGFTRKLAGALSDGLKGEEIKWGIGCGWRAWRFVLGSQGQLTSGPRELFPMEPSALAL
jgi:hypothetical protein